MSQQQTENITVESIAAPDVWQAIADGVNDVGSSEAVFEFDPDGFKTVVKDPANVALIKQRITAADFEHFDADGEFASGLDTNTLDDLLSAIGDAPVRFGWDWDAYKWDFHADDVDYDLSGIQPDAVNQSPAEVPPVKDEHDYCIDVKAPVDKLKRASKIVDMNTEIATFRMGGEDGEFIVEGGGDTDKGRVTLHDSDVFEWNEDPPDTVKECRQSNNYLGDIVGLFDEDTVRIVTGPSLPLHIWTTREGIIDTKILQAPRVSTAK